LNNSTSLESESLKAHQPDKIGGPFLFMGEQVPPKGQSVGQVLLAY